MTSITVRIRHLLLACFFFTASSNVFARGGAGGAFGGMLEWLLVIAIVGGLIGGSLRARFLRRTSWKSLALLSFVTVVATLKFPFLGVFLGTAVIVFLAVFASLSYLMQGGLFQVRPLVSPQKSSDGKPQESKTARVPDIFRWIAATYLFWTVVSLVNFELLSFLSMPPIVLLFPTTIGRFLPFILPPLIVALMIGGMVTAFIVKKLRAKQHIAPFIFNVCVLLTFFASAEIYRYHLLSQSLLDHKPNHLESSSFLNSVTTYRAYFRGPHSSFDEDGKTYRWSYAQCKFVQVQ